MLAPTILSSLKRAALFKYPDHSLPPAPTFLRCHLGTGLLYTKNATLLLTGKGTYTDRLRFVNADLGIF